VDAARAKKYLSHAQNSAGDAGENIFGIVNVPSIKRPLLKLMFLTPAPCKRNGDGNRGGGSGIALHAGVLPGYPASHGCIRLTNDFAIRLWHLTKRGARVINARQDVAPVEITNPHLFVSKLKTAFVVADNSNKTAAATQAPLVSNVAMQETAESQAAGSAPSGAFS
jgi:hypothetical protein